MFDLGMIQIKRLIVHEIPRRYLKSDGNASPPVLSQIESPLTTDVRNFFQERLVSSLSSAYEVQFDPSRETRVPDILRGLLAKSPANFVVSSHELSNLLFENQSGVNPAGLLTLMDLAIGQQKAVAIVKLEKEEGARIERTQVNGRLTFNVSHLRDLMLTQKTRVFKVGLFGTPTGAKEIEGLVCDKQKRSGTTIAFFFLGNYLGCKLKEVAEITTKRFFEATEHFVNTDVAEPKQRAKYEIALVAELQNTRRAISPEAFANTNLAIDDRPKFLERVAEAGITARSFAKDVALVEPNLRRLQWSFESGIAVTARADLVGNKVVVENQPNGLTKMEIIDKLDDVKGHR